MNDFQMLPYQQNLTKFSRTCFMRLTLLVMALAALTSCGQNPHLKVRPKLEVLNPELDPITVNSLLIMRQKGSKKDGVIDFGKIKIGDTSSREVELINIGKAKSTNIQIPNQIGSYFIDNISCSDSLEVSSKCDLNITLKGENEGLQTETLEVAYDTNTRGSDNTAKAYLVGEVEKNVQRISKLVFTPKNFRSGLIVLKDIPLLEKKRIELELRNVGETDVSNLTFSEIKIPYKLESSDCGTELAVDKFCSLVIEYQPTQVAQDDLDLVATSKTNGGPQASQQIKANSVKLNQPAILDVVDGVIHQDIYRILEINPETLSPLHYVRGVDVGILKKGNPISFRLKLQNVGQHPASVTNIRHLKGPEFSYTNGQYPGLNGTCSMNISKGGCVVDILVTPSESKNIYDLVEITYQDGHGQTRRLSVLLFASVGERELVACKTIDARSSDKQREIVTKLTNSGGYKLPYKLQSTTTKAKLQLLYNQDSNLTVRSLSQQNAVIPIVKNAMVQFGFDITQEELSKYPSVRLELDIFKIGTEGSKFDTTEILCLNENRSCSGTFFIDNNYGALKTNNYRMNTSLFSTELLGSAFENAESLRHIFNQMGTQGVISNSSSYSTFRLKKRLAIKELVGSYNIQNSIHGLNFIVADDSLLLGVPKLVLESDFASCPERTSR